MTHHYSIPTTPKSSFTLLENTTNPFQCGIVEVNISDIGHPHTQLLCFVSLLAWVHDMHTEGLPSVCNSVKLCSDLQSYASQDAANSCISTISEFDSCHQELLTFCSCTQL